MYRLFLSTLCLLLSLGSIKGATSTIKVEIDSMQIFMGQVTRMHVNIVTDANRPARLVDLPDMIVEGVEKHSENDGDTTSLGNNRIEIKKEIVLQSFDSGVYIIPPLQLVGPSGDTILSNHVTLKVFPVPVDTLSNIHPYADVSTVERKLSDYVPQWVISYGWWILLGAALIAAAIFVYFRWLRPGRKPKAKKVEPPYEAAMRQFKILGDEHLCEKGQEKEFYTRLTDILRTYLERRFNIYAMEMTSTQIIEAIHRNEETNPNKELVERILRMADFVKFAKARPLPEDNIKSLAQAIKFVEDTKPVEKPEEENPAQPASRDTKVIK